MALSKKQQDWINVINAWSVSGLTQAQYCQQNNISLKSFSNWKYRLDKKRKGNDETGDFLPVTVNTTSSSTNAPVTVMIAGVHIQYYHNTDPSLFMGLVNLLRGES